MSSDEDYSSSDSEYNENEKILLKKYKNRYSKDSESENEAVLGVGSGEDDSEDDNDANHLSDIEGQDSDDDLPDVRAWGKDKRRYYGTDYIDADFDGYQEKDIQAAEIEEEEAKNLQKHLAQQLDDNDFNLDVIFQKKDQERVKDTVEEVIKVDLSKLTDKEKLNILQKESPEFFALIDDFKAKSQIAKDHLHPIIKKLENSEIETCEATRFIQVYYNLILNYCTNIYMYLLLKSTKELNNHPVIKRLFQYRQLFSKLDPVFQEVIQPQFELLLKLITGETTTVEVEEKTKKRKKSSDISANKEQSIKKSKVDDSEKNTKKVQFASTEEIHKIDNENVEETVQLEDNQHAEQEIEKRPITYQIAKNKGLTPRRKKENRNPRVKNKLKYRKALIRRKGAVREPRTELKKYSGEISGIKASVSKSIKIKC